MDRLAQSTHTPYPNGFRFNSHDDALNYINELVENSTRRLGVDKFDAADSYASGYSQLVVRGKIGVEPIPVYLDLILYPVPSVYRTSFPALYRSIIDLGSTGNCSYGKHNFMFAGVTEVVQGKDKVIPAFVWLDGPHNIKNLDGGSIAVPVQSWFKILDVPNNWKCRSLSLSDAKDCLIQSGSKVVACIKNEARQFLGQWFSQSECEYLFTGLKIDFLLNDVRVRLGHKKVLTNPFEIVDMQLRPVNAVF